MAARGQPSYLLAASLVVTVLPQQGLPMLTHFLSRSAADFFRARSAAPVAPATEPAGADDRHLEAAVSWLKRSIDVCGGRGSSKGYRFLKGWMPPYPETSGYIIPTLLMLAHETGDADDCRARAHALADWLMSIQLPGGGFAGRELGVQVEPDVFDTGMILLGFNALLHETGSKTIRRAADKAAVFLVSAMDDAGCFVRHLSHGIVHAYNVRSAWGLVAYGKLTDQVRFVEAGMANARWTCAQQDAGGNFRSNAFTRGGNPNTHGIAYVMQGLLQIHDLAGDRDCLASVVLAAEALRRIHRERRWIPSELGLDWLFLSRHVCLTGYAQLAVVLLRLFQISGEESWRQMAEQLVVEVARTQDLRIPSAPHYGAIAGSFPIYGRYAPLQYPNWATKFFIDALIARRQVGRGQRHLNPLQLYGG